ncbi:DUF4097 family beta strand repeat-containing protein [Streptococcus saliviloxodontae]|uniref:DUF4097 domain-containing protein n=1 Tax=Streptococcus saliviloxodontae TaxID=1349416 RepID=A0ABS2PLT1_9STRE|nr:DUF4097 family beta strand repeat-containing protein [Streptococcus saliviloxodontae]MBM7636046.1 hypothetical protein [Streptococcus saliviloxodontae]
MKKIKKLILVIASFGLVLGILLTAIGYFTGGIDELNTLYQQEHKQTFYKKSLDNFTSIKLEDTNQKTGFHDLTIKTTDKDQAYISYAKNGINITNKDKTLTITDKNNSSTSDYQINHLKLSDLIGMIKNNHWTGQYVNEIILYIPKKQVISSIYGHFSGSVSLNNQTVSNLNLTVTSGDFTANNSDISNTNLTLKLGDLYASNSQLKKSQINLQTGDTDFDHLSLTDSMLTLSTGDYYANGVKFLGENTIVSNSGDIDITLDSYDLTLIDKTDNEDNTITNQLKDSKTNFLTIQSSVSDVSIQ